MARLNMGWLLSKKKMGLDVATETLAVIIDVVHVIANLEHLKTTFLG
ncbi:hypothetical protein [Lacticaseibacillus paracasei]|nr:hypothetical protein [Lacticaseibacillus paracasei]MDP0527209.1 hypothetical protein [Lacticaseibacillus paracasei]